MELKARKVYKGLKAYRELLALPGRKVCRAVKVRKGFKAHQDSLAHKACKAHRVS